MFETLPDIKNVSPYEQGTQCPTPTLVQIAVGNDRSRPSQFNARTVAEDGRTILWNSYTGAISVFPKEQKQELDGLLSQTGISGPLSGLAKYLKDRKFLVPEGADEYRQFQ